MGIPDRDQLKIDFLRVVNARKKNPDWLKQEPVFNFFADEFPIFTKEVLSVRRDLASHLQNFEAELMVQRLGSRCRENQLFWIPQHDGWISTTADDKQIAAYASEIILEAIGFLTEITTEPLNQRLYFN